MADDAVTTRAGTDESSWRTYEKQIRDYLVERCGDQANIEYDVKVVGTLSGAKRQADIWVTGIFAGFLEDGTAIVHRPIKRPAQPAFSQKGPCPSRPNLSPAPDVRSAFGAQFHAPTSRSVGVSTISLPLTGLEPEVSGSTA